MNEKFEKEPDPLDDISQQEQEALGQLIDEYLTEHTDLSAVTDSEIDGILGLLIERGPELQPDVKSSLRKAAHFMMRIKLAEKKPD